MEAPTLEFPEILSIKGRPNLLTIETIESIININTTLPEAMLMDKRSKTLLINYPEVNGKDGMVKAYKYTDMYQTMKALTDTAAQVIVVNGDGNIINSTVDTN